MDMSLNKYVKRFQCYQILSPRNSAPSLRFFALQLFISRRFAEKTRSYAEEIPIFFYPQICTDLHRLILRKSVQFCGQITLVKRSINAHFLFAAIGYPALRCAYTGLSTFHAGVSMMMKKILIFDAVALLRYVFTWRLFKKLLIL